jgi:hypothetical protein
MAPSRSGRVPGLSSKAASFSRGGRSSGHRADGFSSSLHSRDVTSLATHGDSVVALPTSSNRAFADRVPPDRAGPELRQSPPRRLGRINLENRGRKATKGRAIGASRMWVEAFRGLLIDGERAKARTGPELAERGRTRASAGGESPSAGGPEGQRELPKQSSARRGRRWPTRSKAEASESLTNVLGLGGDLEPLHGPTTVGAKGDVDEEDVSEEQGPGVALGGGLF